MNTLFESLLAIDTLAELKLTLFILAKATGSGEDCPALTYAEVQSSTRFSPTTIAKGLTKMKARGYIIRHPGTRKQPARYQVLWDKLGIHTVTGSSADTVTGVTWSSKAANAVGADYYFTATGFLDLLPQARDTARRLGYGEDEMVQAVSMVFDKLRTDPPTRNRTGWFLTVLTEKLHAAHAEIRAHREKVIYSQSTGIPGKPV